MASGRRLTQSNLVRSLAVFLADFNERLIVYKLTVLVTTAIDLILITEWRVLGDVNALLLMEGHELLLLQPRMQLHLVNRRDGVCMLKDTLDFLLGKVADSDCLDFTTLKKLLHSFVGLRLSAYVSAWTLVFQLTSR